MTPTIPEQPSLADIKAFMAPTTPAKEPEPKPETSEPAEPEKPAEEHHEAATETAETQPEPEKHDDELPEGVKKRIAKEAEKAARIQSEIDRVVSARKAKEAELEKLTQGEKGSEPVNTPQSSGDKPKRPTFGEKGHEDETWQLFEARQAAYEDARDSWLKAEAKREVQQELEQNTRLADAQEKWDAAVGKHGAEFESLMDSAIKLAPEGLQLAVSGLEHWDDVAVHLAKNPEKLKELAATFEQNPYKAIATLGRIEAAITSKPEPKSAAALPEPAKPVGGSASASGQSIQDTIEKGSFAQTRALLTKIRSGK